jgi:hypothetical protein
MKCFIVFSLLLVSTSLFSQGKYESYFNQELNSKEDYIDAEPKVLECAKFILESKPLDNKEYLMAKLYIVKWMEGAPYTFNLYANASKADKKYGHLYGVYLAGMVTFYLENKDDEPSEKEIEVGAMRLLCLHVQKHELQRKGYLKKLMSAFEDENLEEFLFP